MKIARDASLKETGTEKLQPELQRNEAAVDTELAPLPISQDKYQVTGVVPNPYYGATNGAIFHPTNNLLSSLGWTVPPQTSRAASSTKQCRPNPNGSFWGRAYFDTRGLTNGE